MKETVDMAKEGGAEWGVWGGLELQGMELGETQELTDTTAEELTEDDLTEMRAS